MVIYFTVAILLGLYALRSYRASLAMYIPLSLLLNQNVNILNVPGVPLVSLQSALSAYYIIVLIFNRDIVRDSSSYPVKGASVAIFLSWVVSCIFGLAPFTSSSTQLIRIVLDELIFLWIIWVTIDGRSFKVLFNTLIVVIGLSCIYAIYEDSIHENPLNGYLLENAGGETERILNWTYDEDSPRGYRVRSFFIHPMGAGMAWAMFVCLVVYIAKFHYEKFRRTLRFAIPVALASVYCLVLTKSRTPQIFLLLALVYYIIPRTQLQAVCLFAAALCGTVFLAAFSLTQSDGMALLLSVVDPSKSAEVGGSDIPMRVMQLETCFSVVRDHWLLGLGFKGMSVFHDQGLIKDLLGLESIWFWTIVELGLIGVLVQLMLRIP